MIHNDHKPCDHQMLLMFGVGLHFSINNLLAVKRITVVVLKALEVRGILDSMNGKIAVGWW